VSKGEVKPLIIAGAGGLGREVAWLVEDINKNTPQWNLLGFVDDGVNGFTVEDYPILGDVDSLFYMEPLPWVIVAIANASVRKRIVGQIQLRGMSMATLIHPSVQSSRFVEIGEGSIICAGSVITTNITLGLSSIVNPNCFIGHDTVLQNYVSLMPGVHVAGEVKLGEGVYMGLHSCVINRTSIGEWSIIGAGATVVSDIPPNSLAVGVPARVVKRVRNEEKEQ
jgi:sugar O-acyltransferase (sialic acid O-acetyltransferase NeuD family)